jgi:hypothetical protein
MNAYRSDPVTERLESLKVAGSNFSTIDPNTIKLRSQGSRRVLSLGSAIAFATAVVLILVFVLGSTGSGDGHSSSANGLKPSNRTTTTVQPPAQSFGPNSPLKLTPDPNYPGYACKQGTAYQGSTEIVTILCVSTSPPHGTQGPLWAGESPEQIARDCKWSYVPDVGAPVANAKPTH